MKIISNLFPAIMMCFMIDNANIGRNESVIDNVVISLDLFIYLGFCVGSNTVQVISRWVVGRAEETSTYSWLRFCIVNC